MTDTLGDLSEAGLISIRTGPFGSALHAHEYANAGVSVIPTEAIVGGIISREKLVFVSSEKAEELDRYRLEPGDIVFARRGAQACGVSALIKSDLPEAIAGTGIIALRINDKSAIDSEFLSYLVGSDQSVGWLKHHAIGATMPNLNSSIILSLPATIPEMAEQKAIAHILGTLDDKIELNRQMNATLEAMAQALFKSWFVDFDPVIDNALAAGNPIPEPLQARSDAKAALGDQRKPLPAAIRKQFPDRFVFNEEIGWVPEGWQLSSLGEATKLRGGFVQTGPFGSQLHASDYLQKGIPVVMPRDIARRRISTDSVARIGVDDVVRLSRHKLRAGDLVYSRRGNVENHALTSMREEGWICGTGCLLVRLGETWISPKFASLALEQPSTKSWISQHAIGATMPNLNTSILGLVPILMPTDGALEAFESQLAASDALQVARAAETQTLKKVRDTLLPKLLSGQLRIPDAEKQVEAVV